MASLCSCVCRYCYLYVYILRLSHERLPTQVTELPKHPESRAIAVPLQLRRVAECAVFGKATHPQMELNYNNAGGLPCLSPNSAPPVSPSSTQVQETTLSPFAACSSGPRCGLRFHLYSIPIHRLTL